MRHIDPALRELATAQHGVFSARQSARLAVDPSDLRRSVASGQLARVRQGAYLLTSAAAGQTTPEQAYALRVRAVLTTRRLHTWASHHAALAVHELPLVGFDLSRVDLCAQVKSTFRRSGVCTHPVPAGEPCLVVKGVPTVSTELALVQACASTGLRAALPAADAALHLDLVTCDGLLEGLHRARLGRRQHRRVQKMIDLADALAESPGESLTRLLLHGLGLSFRSQVAVRDSRGLVGRVDFLVEERIVVEFDGMVKYDGAEGRAALAAEKLREDRLRAAGYEVVRLTWADLRQPQRVAQLIRAQPVRGRDGLTRGSWGLVGWRYIDRNSARDVTNRPLVAQRPPPVVGTTGDHDADRGISERMTRVTVSA